MIGIFFDDVTPYNTPVLAIAGSHKDSLVSEAIIDENVADHMGVAKFRFDITDDTLSHLVNRNGMKSIEGPAGTVLFMNIAVVHGSSVNSSPLRRLLPYVYVDAVDNRGECFAWLEYCAARDLNPLEELGQGCLLSYYKSSRESYPPVTLICLVTGSTAVLRSMIKSCPFGLRKIASRIALMTASSPSELRKGVFKSASSS